MVFHFDLCHGFGIGYKKRFGAPEYAFFRGMIPEIQDIQAQK
jgi:hypothetical protein